jgi:hypothetical protein
MELPKQEEFVCWCEKPGSVQLKEIPDRKGRLLYNYLYVAHSRENRIMMDHDSEKNSWRVHDIQWHYVGKELPKTEGEREDWLKKRKHKQPPRKKV